MFNFNSHKTLERTEYFRRNQFSSEHFKMHHNTSECIFYRKEIVATHLQSDKKKEDHQKRWQTWKMDSGDGVFSFKCVCTEKASCWWVVKRIINYLYFINFLWHKKPQLFFQKRHGSHTSSIWQKEDHSLKKMANLELGFRRCGCFHSSQYVQKKHPVGELLKE